MENIKVGLISSDREYIRALGLALVNVYRNFTVTLFHSVPVHNELDKMDLVLTDSEETAEIKGKYILLTEKFSQVNLDYDEKAFFIYKYSNARHLAGELLLIYSAITGRKAAPIRNTSARIVVFSSAEGGTGCTSVAFSFAREMTRFHGQKVLYISLEELESTKEYVGEGEQRKTIGDYLYYLLDNEDPTHFPFLEPYIVRDPYGVETFMPSRGRNVLRTLSPQEILYFIGAVMDTGKYDAVVIDASNNMDKGTLTCYEMANNIVMVSGGGGNRDREERFTEFIAYTKGEKILERMVKVVNGDRGESTEARGREEAEYRLPYDRESFYFTDGIRMTKPEGKFGNEMKKFASELVKVNI